MTRFSGDCSRATICLQGSIRAPCRRACPAASSSLAADGTRSPVGRAVTPHQARERPHPPSCALEKANIV